MKYLVDACPQQALMGGSKTIRGGGDTVLVVALENDAPFDLQQLYLLSYNDFDIALNALREWRSQRYVWMREHESDQPWRSHTA